MKINKILLFAITLAMGIFVVLPVFAYELDMSDLSDLDKVANILNKEIKKVKVNTQSEGGNYLKEHTLDFLEYKDIVYFRYTGPYEAGRVDCSKSEYCKQFNEMSSLIANHDNDTLKKRLDEGYDPGIFVYIGNGTKERNLFTQAILANNKEAVGLIYNKIKENGLSFYYGDDFKSFFTEDDVIRAMVYRGLASLLPDDEIELRNRFSNELYYKEQELLENKTSITSKDISNAVITEDYIGFHVACALLTGDYENIINIFYNAIYEVIDYRIAQGY